jgi:glycosyltransferase involved in cell wall biosynthesis
MKLVSVIIVCHDLGQYLDEAVDSVLAQTYQEFEIIIVNHRSTDPFTRKLLTEYRRPKTCVLTTENRGSGAARNAALQVAHGSYLCILEADDKLGPSYLEMAVKFFDEDESIGYVTSCPRNPDDEDSASKQMHLDLPGVLSDSTLTTPAMVRWSAVMEVGGYEDDPDQWGSEDWLLWISLAERGYDGVTLPEGPSYYEKKATPLGVSRVQGQDQLEKLRRGIAKHEDTYRRHLLDVLIRMEARSCDLLKISYDMERHLDTWLIPLVQRRKDELERMRPRLETLERERQLALKVEELNQEMFRLHNSKSWKITAPLRAIYDRLLQLAGRPIPRN